MQRKTTKGILQICGRSEQLYHTFRCSSWFSGHFKTLDSSENKKFPASVENGFSVSFWKFVLLQAQFRVRFPALPDFLSSSGSGTGSTQPREVNWGATWIKSSGSGPKNRLTAVGIRCADHVTPIYPQKVGTNFADRRRPLCRYSSLAD